MKLKEGMPMGHLDTAAVESDKIRMLLDYTIFHIGVYISLGTILTTLCSANAIHLSFSKKLLVPAIGLIGLAGLAGGVVASSLPEADTLSGFLKSPAGFWDLNILTGRIWTRVEHSSFWFGLFLGAWSFLSGRHETHA